MIDITITCYNCGRAIELNDRVTNNATCPGCSSYLRCCLNCKYHDPVAYNECREPQADRVKEKDKANFCDFFEVTAQSHFQHSSRKEDALKKLNALFKDSSPKSDDDHD